MIAQTVSAALREDIGSGDISAALIPSHQIVKATIIVREPAIICGIEWVNETFKQIDNNIKLDWKVKEGDPVSVDQIICHISGPAKNILTAERTALNFLQTLSGTATLTAKYVAKLNHTKTKLLDTRKTIPGLRYAQKYAVKCGGGFNHRMGLYDAYLIKENHIMACGSIKAAVTIARKNHPEKLLEVEVENLQELEEALNAKVARILLDNFDLSVMKEAVKITNHKAELEVSGNINLANIAEIAATGVDYISVGAITKHIQAIDLSLRFL